MSMMSLIPSLGLVLVALQTPTARVEPGVQAADSGQLRVMAELDAAETRYRAALVLHPQTAAYQFSLASVLERRGKTAEALRAYAEAVRLDSSSARNRAGFGKLLLDLGEHARAADQLRAAVQHDPNQVSYRVWLAQALLAQQSWTDATQTLREAQQLSPTDTHVASLLAQAEHQANATTQNYHDYSDFESATSSWTSRAARSFIGFALAIAGLPLLAPIFGIMYVLLVQAPLQWARAGRPRV